MPEPGPLMRPRRRPRRRAGAWLAVALGLAVPAVSWWLAGAAADRVEAWLDTEQGVDLAYPIVVEVPRGSGAAAIARSFGRAGLLPGRERLAWVAWLGLTGQAARLQAGEYELKRPISPEDLARMLIEGRVLLHPVTVPEGLSLEETAALLAASGSWRREELESAFRDASPIASLDGAAPDLEGYLYPETYHFAKGSSPEEVARALSRGFERTWRELGGDAKAEGLGLSVRELVTLASLVEKETALPQEHRLVASVFHNRLKRGMKLECDPTVIRALELDGLWTGGPLQKAQLAHPSPYNTYFAPGLPPGPIASPGRAALAAALAPAESRLLYFVADGSGGHAFAETHAQHERNVRTWRRLQAGRR